MLLEVSLREGEVRAAAAGGVGMMGGAVEGSVTAEETNEELEVGALGGGLTIVGALEGVGEGVLIVYTSSKKINSNL